VPESVKKRRLGRVVLRKETAHRGGKVVIVVDDFPAETTEAQLEQLAKGLRQALGTGGTVKDRRIEMQGNQPEKVRSFLREQGYDVAGI
jgi:translation initiation factor 1